MDNTFNPSAEILLEEAPQQKFPWLNVALFVLTCLTTMVTGTFLMTSFNNTFTGFSGLFRLSIAFHTREWASIQPGHYEYSACS